VIIFILSSQVLNLKFDLTFSDKGAHWLEFMGLGFLLALGFFYNLPRQPFLAAYLTVMIGISVGLVDELYQRYIPGRHCDWRDWIADIIGVIVGLAIFWLFFNLKKKKFAGKDSSGQP
jgi:VanZ family protein